MTLDGYKIEARRNETLANTAFLDTIVIVYDPKHLTEAQQKFLHTYQEKLASGVLNHGTTVEDVRAWMGREQPQSVEQRTPFYVAGMRSREANGLPSALEGFLREHS